MVNGNEMAYIHVHCSYIDMYTMDIPVSGGRGPPVGGVKGLLDLSRGARPTLPAAAMEGGPPEKSLKEGCVCCHDGFVRC